MDVAGVFCISFFFLRLKIKLIYTHKRTLNGANSILYANIGNYNDVKTASSSTKKYSFFFFRFFSFMTVFRCFIFYLYQHCNANNGCVCMLNI